MRQNFSLCFQNVNKACSYLTIEKGARNSEHGDLVFIKVKMDILCLHETYTYLNDRIMTPFQRPVPLH